MTPAEHWEVICADRSLRDLPYKIETNRFHQIVMSPSSNWHSDYQSEIAALLRELMRDGSSRVEFAVETDDGIRVPDVAWISKSLRARYGRTVAFPVSPEICVEVVSPSNCQEELDDKMRLYFARGASEVWLCDEEGHMSFFTSDHPGEPATASRLCPAFPATITID